MELLDLYTRDRVRTGKTMVRGEEVPEGYYRLVMHVCIFSPEGKMLIQQRQPWKRAWPNLWDVSVCGSAIAGDTSKAAAERETREELGLEVDLSDECLSMTLYWEDGFDDFYILTQTVDLRMLKLQYEEVQQVRWASREEILQMIDDGSFIPYEKNLMDLLFLRKDCPQHIYRERSDQ
ncbi:MAG: NUDIX domain-containing protein [Clostridia bacterium]|nr:NUDIX domain-containing protein [Clostridia bacterium]